MICIFLICAVGAAAECSGTAPVLRRIDASSLSPVLFAQLLEAHHPFVVKGVQFPGVYDRLTRIYEEESVELWNQTLEYKEIFRREHDTRGDHLCPCAEMSSSIVADSSELKEKRDFQVVERAVHPYSRVDREIVQPLLQHSQSQWIGNLSHINLFNSIFLSRGKSQGVFHFHNYDAFASFPVVGHGTKLVMARPGCFKALRGTIRKAKATVINAFGWNETELENTGALLEYEIEAGDVLHFPAGWFHRVDHRGDYLNIANAFFFPHVLDQRLAAILPVLSNAEEAAFFEKWTRRHPWWWTIAPSQYFYEMARDCKHRNAVSAGLVLVLSAWWISRKSKK